LKYTNFLFIFRVESFCKAVVFTHRPVRVNEKIFIRFIAKADSWSGSIRFGFSAVDPRSLQGQLPKYACPDLTNRPGYWAKALSEKFADKDSVMYYYVTNGGDVVFGVNGEDKGVFFSGVDTRRQLWGLVDVYGNSNVIELVDPRRSLNNMVTQQQQKPVFNQQHYTLDRNSAVIGGSNQPVYGSNNSGLRRSESCGRITPCSNTANSQYIPYNTNTANSSSYYGSRRLAKATFHRGCVGQHVTLNQTGAIASRLDTEFCHGYVFLDSLLQPGESVVVRVLETESTYVGSLTFGLTSADPAARNMTASSLPEDSELLLQRPEYWVLSKDVISAPYAGDELCFTLGLDGAVLCSVNNGPDRVLFHSDISIPTRPFIDIYGVPLKIQLLGVAPAVNPNNNCSTSSPLKKSSQTPSISRKSVKTMSPRPKSCIVDPHSLPCSVNSSLDISHDSGSAGSNFQASNDCVICYESDVDCVLYSCGHMCMCFTCAVQQFNSSGECPLCRATIRDVIRTYRA
jgi:protein neuralized